MSSRHLAIAACAALVLAACSIGKPIPQATTYVVEPPAPAARTAAAQRPETLRMGNVRVAAAFAGNSLVYRADDVQYQSDPYNAFIADPATMLGNQMAAWLDRAGPFKAVTQPGSGRPGSHVLEATVTELYGDFRTGRPPAAVLTVQFALIDMTGPRLTTAYERTIARRVDIAQASADALVQGYGKALAEILAQLSAELAAQSTK